MSSERRIAPYGAVWGSGRVWLVGIVGGTWCVGIVSMRGIRAMIASNVSPKARAMGEGRGRRKGETGWRDRKSVV